MSWILKILLRDYQRVEKIWGGASFSTSPLSTHDFIINDFRLSSSNWRRVSYTPISQEDIIHRQDVSSTVSLSSDDKPLQFLNPLVESVTVLLPDPPLFNTRYIIKNLSTTNNKLLLKKSISGPTLVTLDSLNKIAYLFHDTIQFHIHF